MRRHWLVTYAFDVHVEAEDKYEAQRKAEAEAVRLAYTVDEIIEGDPLEVRELDADEVQEMFGGEEGDAVGEPKGAWDGGFAENH